MDQQIVAFLATMEKPMSDLAMPLSEPNIAAEPIARAMLFSPFLASTPVDRSSPPALDKHKKDQFSGEKRDIGLN